MAGVSVWGYWGDKLGNRREGGRGREHLLLSSDTFGGFSLLVMHENFQKSQNNFRYTANQIEKGNKGMEANFQLAVKIRICYGSMNSMSKIRISNLCQSKIEDL